jgi:plastocyanin
MSRMVKLVIRSVIVLLVTGALLGGVVTARAAETVLLREGPSPALLVVPGPSLTALATPSPVDIVDRAYAPVEVSISAGDTVEWLNRDGERHTVTALDGAFDSGLMARGMTYALDFEVPGTFEYGCTIHPEMRGRVIVSAPPSEDPATAPVASPAPSPGTDTVAGDAAVSLVDVTYQPSLLGVTAGTTVRWTNDDPVVHTVTARDGSFDSGVMRPGDVFSLVFETPGRYDYFCAIHPGQAGSVVVTAPGG